MKLYRLIGSNSKEYTSEIKGTLGGHRASRIYGRLDCATALRYLTKGQYAKYRVFFADEKTAIEAGYRPCARCMPDEYRAWRDNNQRCHESLPSDQLLHKKDKQSD